MKMINSASRASKLLYKIGYYKPRVETWNGIKGIGLTRNLFGYGKVVPGGFWGGGISAPIERAKLKSLLNPNKPLNDREEDLDRIIRREMTFDHIPVTEVVSQLEQLLTHEKLGPKAQQALQAISPRPKAPVPAPPPLPTAKAAEVEKEAGTAPSVFEGGPSYPAITFESIVLAGGQEGEVLGANLGEPNMAGVTYAAGRKKNEDAIAFRKEGDNVLITVADGMGGHAKGEVASRLAIEAIDQELALSVDGRISLESAYRSAHEAIVSEKALDELKYKDMGTTAASVYVMGSEGKAQVASVGDSRVLLLRKGELHLLTIDHTNFVSYNYRRNGVATPVAPLPAKESERFWDATLKAESETGEMGNFFKSLNKALGMEAKTRDELHDPIQDFKVTEIEVKYGDIILLLSDGAFKGMSYAEIRQLLADNAEKTPLELAQAIKEAAHSRMSEGKGDNISVAVYKEERTISDSMIMEEVYEEFSPVEHEVTPPPLEGVEPELEEPTIPPAPTPAEPKTRVWDAQQRDSFVAETRMWGLSEDHGMVLAKAMDKDAQLREAVDTAARLIADKNRKISDLESANKLLENNNEKLMQRLDSIQEELGAGLEPFMGFIKGEEKDKMKLLNGIIIGKYDFTGKEMIAIAVITLGCRGGSPELLEAARDAINLIIV